MDIPLHLQVPPRPLVFETHSTKPRDADKLDSPFSDYSRLLRDACGVIVNPHDILSSSDDSVESDTLSKGNSLQKNLNGNVASHKIMPGGCTVGHIRKRASQKKKPVPSITPSDLIEKAMIRLRDHDTESKIKKLERLYYQGRYLLHPRKKRMIIVQQLKLKYLSPLWPTLAPTKQFRIYDYVFSIDSDCILRCSASA